MGPPKRMAQFEIHYDSGIQDLKSWLEFMKEHSMITGTSAKWTFRLPSAEYKFSTQEFVDKVNNDAKFKDEVYTMICDKQIMKYRDSNSKIEEDVEISDGSGDEENEVVDIDKKVKDVE